MKGYRFIFTGFLYGRVKVVHAFSNESEAVKAWENYTGACWLGHGESDFQIEGTMHEGSTIRTEKEDFIQSETMPWEKRIRRGLL